MKIISGGQTGVDRGALDAALSLGVPCGGNCPPGRRDEAGIIPARYPLQELASGGYAKRTERNVTESDATAVIYRENPQGGTRTTLECCAKAGKPACLIDASRMTPAEAAEQLRRFLNSRRVEVINVAGPRASEWPEGYDFARQTVLTFLSFAGAPSRGCDSRPENVERVPSAG